MRRNYLIPLFMLLATFLFPGGASEFGYKKYELVRQPNGQYTATASDKTVSFPSTVSDGYRVSFSDSYYEVITYGSKKYLIPSYDGGLSGQNKGHTFFLIDYKGRTSGGKIPEWVMTTGSRPAGVAGYGNMLLFRDYRTGTTSAVSPDPASIMNSGFYYAAMGAFKEPTETQRASGSAIATLVTTEVIPYVRYEDFWVRTATITDSRSDSYYAYGLCAVSPEAAAGAIQRVLLSFAAGKTGYIADSGPILEKLKESFPYMTYTASQPAPPGSSSPAASTQVPAASGQRPDRSAQMIITVLDLRTQNISEAEGILITDLLGSAIFGTGMYRVIDRGQRETVLSEMKFSLSGCADEACQLEVGRMLAVDGIVVGTLGKVSNRFILNVKLLDVETTEALATAYRVFGSLDELVDGCESVAQSLRIK